MHRIHSRERHLTGKTQHAERSAEQPLGCQSAGPMLRRGEGSGGLSFAIARMAHATCHDIKLTSSMPFMWLYRGMPRA